MDYKKEYLVQHGDSVANIVKVPKCTNIRLFSVLILLQTLTIFITGSKKETRLGCFYVAAIFSWGYGWGWVEVDLNLRLKWGWDEI